MFTINEINLDFCFGVPCLVFENLNTKEKISIKKGKKLGVYDVYEYANGVTTSPKNYDNEFLLKTRIIEILNNVH